LNKAGDVILCGNKAKNVDIAVAMARLFNEVSVQKNKPEWSSYFVTMPKQKKQKELASCLHSKVKHYTMKKTIKTSVFNLGKNKYI